MHQNTPLPDKKIKKKISGEGARPPPQSPSPLGRGIPSPQTPPRRRLDSRAFGVPITVHLRLEHCVLVTKFVVYVAKVL